jgi:hypothetical protein
MALKGDNTFSFSIAEVGETTGEKFNWAFTAKRRLSIRDLINKDAQRRFIIGDRPETAAPETLMRAEMLAYLSVSITESPKEWRESQNGLDLYDDNILIKMYETIQEAQAKATQEVAKAAEESKEKLRKVARKKDEDQKDEGSSGGA